MRILRGFSRGIQGAFLFTAATSLALVLVVATPSAAHAEGFLYGTVKCLLRTVLAPRPAECSPASSRGAENVTQSERTTTERKNTGSTTRQAPKNELSHTAPAPATPNTSSEVIPPKQPLPLPDATLKSYPDTETVPSVQPVARDWGDAEYVAYFNSYSPYAASTEPQTAALIEPSTEGWKIAGVPWYWWSLGVGALLAVFLSVKHGKFRKSSVLPKH